MYVHDLSKEQIKELKGNYMAKLVNEGTFSEVTGKPYDEPSWMDLSDPDEIISDDVIFREYEGVVFSSDDFFCTGTT